jgi:N-acyl-D-aspartate/D-glutamate deacylase
MGLVPPAAGFLEGLIALCTKHGALLVFDEVISGLADGGAHVGTICDASLPTYLLTHWVRDRQGKRLSIEAAVKKQTHDTAQLYGLNDRGRSAEGR